MILTSLLDGLLQLLILLPFVFVAKQRNKSNSNTYLIYAAIIYLATGILIDALSTVSFFPGQQYNWVGKGIAFALELILAFSIPGFSSREFGLTTNLSMAGAKPVLMLCNIYVFIRLALYVFSGQASYTVHGETVLFQATLPGLQEELLFRGILLALLNRVFQRPKFTILKVSFGWAAILTSILFGLAHSVHFNGQYGVNMNFFIFARTAFDGMLFALLTEKTKSIFPAVIYHNLLNVISNH